jgi:hypothetical protein
MRLWAEALDIAHATRMKLISNERLCRGVTAYGRLDRGAFQDASERDQNAGCPQKCQILIPSRFTEPAPKGIASVR